MMKLSPKALRYVVEALDYYLRDRDQQVRDGDTSDDDRADWENDRQFIDAIRQECLDEMAHQHVPDEVEV